VIAVVALFVAASGIAAALPGKNKVKNDDVKDLRYKALVLQNGWGGSFDAHTPGAAIDAQGTVHLRGGLAQNIADDDLFARLPAPLRPDETVTLLTANVNTNTGRILIAPNGEMRSIANGSQSNAQLFTSLDGLTFDAGG
jgi:hypothetical protein